MNDYQSNFPPRSKRNEATKKNSFWQELISTIKYVFVISLIFAVVHRFFFAPVMVDGDSMEPTLANRDYLLLNKFSDIERFDIIVFPPPHNEETQYVKRVIGMPGDSIEYYADVLFVNGEIVEETFLESKDSEAQLFYSSGNFSLSTLFDIGVVSEETVPEGHYFVLGDNRFNSRDSRSFGYIDEETVLGKVSLRYWPFETFGTVE